MTLDRCPLRIFRSRMVRIQMPRADIAVDLFRSLSLSISLFLPLALSLSRSLARALSLSLCLGTRLTYMHGQVHVITFICIFM